MPEKVNEHEIRKSGLEKQLQKNWQKVLAQGGVEPWSF